VVIPLTSRDIFDGIVYVLKFYKNRGKIPVNQFFRTPERNLKTKLAKETKDEILYSLHRDGRVIKDKKGKTYILPQNIKQYE
jgi:hypothetical protein